MKGKNSFRKDYRKGISSIPRVKPKFNVSDFLQDIQLTSEEITHKFIDFVNKKYSSHNYEKISNFVGEAVNKEELIGAVHSNGHIVFIKSSTQIGSYTYEELAHIIEFGRKDKGLLPDPIIRTAFIEFKKEYRKSIKEMLVKK